MSKVTYIQETPPVFKEVSPAQPASIFLELSLEGAVELMEVLVFRKQDSGLSSIYKDLKSLHRQGLI